MLLVSSSLTGGLGRARSDAEEEVDPAVDRTHISLDAPVWCGVYKAAAMLCHIYIALCRILSLDAQDPTEAVR